MPRAGLAPKTRDTSLKTRDKAARDLHATLEWPGRSWQPGSELAAGAPAKVLELPGKSPDPHVACRLLWGDVLDIARTLTYEEIAGTVSCVYVDPPYASQADYVHEARIDGGADGRLKRSLAYEDSWSPGAYLDMLAPRLDALVSLLSPRGTIWVQVDWRASSRPSRRRSRGPG